MRFDFFILNKFFMVVKRGRSDALPLFVCLNDLGNQKPVLVIHMKCFILRGSC